MSTELVTARTDTPVKELAGLLVERGISSIPVVDDAGRVLGVVTERDLVHQDARIHFPTFFHFLESYLMLPGSVHRFEKELQKAVGATAEDLMDKEPSIVGPEAEMESVATLMAEKDVPVVLVVEGWKLIGLVTRTDILKTLATG
jgi:CBS domain-containing protein